MDGHGATFRAWMQASVLMNFGRLLTISSSRILLLRFGTAIRQAPFECFYLASER